LPPSHWPPLSLRSHLHRRPASVGSRATAALSGDFCYGIFEQRRVVRFELATAARYFGRYRICIRPPAGATICKSFPVVARGQAFGGVVRWARNYPYRGPGAYRVTWRLGATALGRALVFTLPL
jgi:hypothetical protein